MSDNFDGTRFFEQIIHDLENVKKPITESDRTGHPEHIALLREVMTRSPEAQREAFMLVSAGMISEEIAKRRFVDYACNQMLRAHKAGANRAPCNDADKPAYEAVVEYVKALKAKGTPERNWHGMAVMKFAAYGKDDRTIRRWIAPLKSRAKRRKWTPPENDGEGPPIVIIPGWAWATEQNERPATEGSR